MPIDKNIDEEEEAKGDKDIAAGDLGSKRRFKEFDCPDCSANNPADETIGNEDAVVCSYCGQEFTASVNDDGKLKLKPG